MADLLKILYCCRSSGGGAGGQAAKDALGNDVKSNAWLSTHQKGDRSLTQGLKVNDSCSSNSSSTSSMNSGKVPT
jgi:hypothetical protein